MKSHECEAEVRSENEVRVRVKESDFSFRLTGFDERDVVVQVQPLANEILESDSAEVPGP